jgi:hypothetical protein
MAAKLKIEKRGDEIKKKSSLKLLSQSQPNFAEMILGWSPFKNVSISAVLHPRWPPLLKIEFFSNVQNCSILSQKVPKHRVLCKYVKLSSAVGAILIKGPNRRTHFWKRTIQ